MKYAVSREFFPYSLVAPPIQNAAIAGWMGSLMRPPRWICRDKEIAVTREMFTSYDGAEVELLLFEPRGMEAPAPCLVYYHGGGFFFGGAGYHYTLAKQYALGASCKVAFVQYRLAPKHPHPTPAEDSYAALCHVFDHADRLGVDRTRIAVGGDSAGGALAAAVCHMARDRGTEAPCFQLLVYPVTDRRMQTASCKMYTDTPMWNARLSEKMWKGYVQSEDVPDLAYASPMEAASFKGLPPAYVETAEFDCLHDEGVAYAEALCADGVAVVLNDTKGTMHGYDIMQNAPTSKASIAQRIRYMCGQFSKPHRTREE